jgi:hypothetical protein
MANNEINIPREVDAGRIRHLDGEYDPHADVAWHHETDLHRAPAGWYHCDTEGNFRGPYASELAAGIAMSSFFQLHDRPKAWDPMPVQTQRSFRTADIELDCPICGKKFSAFDIATHSCEEHILAELKALKEDIEKERAETKALLNKMKEELTELRKDVNRLTTYGSYAWIMKLQGK